MESIFDLKTTADELDSLNEGTSRMDYEQHPPTRDVVGDNFANGAIHFRFQCSGQKWWVPARSYIRTRFRLEDGTGEPVALNDGVAPNMGLMSTLFQSCEMRINDKTVSRVSDFVAQVDALETRLSKSKAWLDSVGEATNWWDDNQQTRLTEASSDGVFFDVNSPPTQSSTARTAMNFDAAGGLTAAARNQWAYDAATGNFTYTQGTDGAGLDAADATAEFPDGSYFAYVGLDAAGAPLPTQLVEITGSTGVGNLTSAPFGLGVNVASDGRNDFRRVIISIPSGAVQPSRQVGEFELTWCPPLSLFKIGHSLPCGRYELILNPQTATAFQTRAIEAALGLPSKEPRIASEVGKDFKVKVVNMYLYTSTVEGPRADNISYLIPLEQTRCQAEKIDNDSFGQKNFDVSPSTYALTVAYQDTRAGNHTSVSVSKFKAYEAGAAPVAQQELSLNRFFINYAGQNLPSPDADPEFVAGTDYTTQRYTETMIHSGAWYDDGGAETIQEYHARGAYYYFNWPRDGTDRSTRVNVHSSMTGADVSNMRMLLFDHSKQVAMVRIQDGYVVDVQLEDQ